MDSVVKNGLEDYAVAGEILKANRLNHIIEIESKDGNGSYELSKHGLSVTGLERNGIFFNISNSLSDLVDNQRILRFIKKDFSKFKAFIEYDAVVGMKVWERIATSFSSLINMISKTTICDGQIIGLSKSFERWKPSFIKELDLKNVEEIEKFVLNEFWKFGYTKQELIYESNERKTFFLLK